MARMYYVEPEEEITDLVERVRDSGDERDLVFVLPNRARVLQSQLNLRLLQQYTRSFVKTAAIVSGDPRVQALARDAGFAAFASVAAYERGVPAEPVLEPAAATAAGERPQPAMPPIGTGAGGGPSAGATVAGDDDAGAPPIPVPVAVAAIPPPPVRPPARPTRVTTAASPRRPRDRRGVYVSAAAIFIVGILLLFLVAPSAKVTVVLQAAPVKVDGVILQGTPDSTAATAPDKVLTVVATSDQSQQFQATPTGKKDVPAAAATASVQFQNAFNTPFCVSLVKGTTVAQSSGGLNWVVTDTPTPSCESSSGGGVLIPASTDGKPGPPSEPIGVTAATTGAATNVAAGAINQVDPKANGCNPDNYPPGQAPKCSPSDITVSNAAAAAGGVDAKTLTIVSADDLKGFQAQVDELTKSLSDKAKADMQSHNPGKSFAVDASGNGLTMSTDINPPLPKVNDTFNPTMVTVTAHGKAAMYDPREVRSKVEDALRKEAQSQQQGSDLSTAGKVIPDPTVQQAGDDGVVVFNGKGSGYITPTVDLGKLKDSFSGKSKSTVTMLVRQQYGNAVQDVQISQSIPFFVLPFFSGRIEVSLCVRSPDSNC